MLDFTKFEKKIGIKFNDLNLLQTAFTHRSYINEQKEKGLEHNERLEFLGDAVLELVSTRHLFDKFPAESEGVLTSYRSALVNTNSLLAVAKKLKVNDFLLLSKGEKKDIGRARTFIMADAVEAIIGAIYLDRGYAAAQKFIADNFLCNTDEVVRKSLWQDAKSHFQEKAQEIEKTTPLYKVLKEIGPDHNKQFQVGVFLEKQLIAKGKGVSKQEAEQEAAKEGLKIKEWS
ncbi:MAG: ribonuclease III [Candidatus Pacebacteria bacterium]|nr:ribonuclease III [Candidatus Paceibacterota bacterium]